MGRRGPVCVGVEGRTLKPLTSEAELPFLVAQLSLLNGEGGAPMDYAGGGAGTGAGAGAGRGGAQERLLYGSLVSSPHLLRNLQGRRGAYFMFPDVAVRQCGRFQLKVTLIRLPRSVQTPLGGRRDGLTPFRFDDPALLTRQRPDGTIVAEARSLPFDVFPRRDYVAPGEHTFCARRSVVGDLLRWGLTTFFGCARSSNAVDAVLPAAGRPNVRVCI